MKTKEEVDKNHRRHQQNVQGDYFWFEYPRLYGVAEGTSKAA